MKVYLPNKQLYVPIELAQLGDRVWFDTDADGIQDAGEDGISGVEVSLLADINGDGNIDASEVIETTTTDADGNYDFEVVPGEYRVAFDQPEGFGVSPVDAGGDDTVDSDGLISDVVTLSPGEFNPTIDSGFYELASLGDFVWHDLNADGIQNDNEPGIANAEVQLINPATGDIIATTTTDADGLYNFDNLEPGDYKVKFITPNGFTENSPADQGGDDAIDSDGMMVTTNLSVGENDLTLDSGFYNLASLGDYVFIDNNGDGVQNAGDSAIGGVTVELLQDGSVIGTTTTNSDGSYLFDGLTPGDYQVKFTAPQNYNFTTANVGDDSLDSDADATTGLTSVVTLTSGEFNSTLDAGLVENAPAPIEEIDIEKFVNGIDVTNINNLPSIVAGEDVTFTYTVKNTGNVDFAFNEVIVVDDNGTPLDTSDDFTPTLVASSDDGADGILSADETWLYTSTTQAAQDLATTVSQDVSFTFNGNSSSANVFGNDRTFTSDGVTVDVSAFSFNSSKGWQNAFVGDYSGGLGVINRNSDSDHRIDNTGSLDFLVFEFDNDVVVDKAFLKYVGSDSDISFWIGDRNGDISHLNNNILNGFTEGQNWGGSNDRWANINNNELSGNTFIISAHEHGTNDSFKLNKLDISKITTSGDSSYVNTATVEAGSAIDSDASGYINEVANPGINLEKFTNGFDVTDANNLPTIAVGADVTFTYTVENTGNVSFALSDVDLVDDNGTPDNAHDDFAPTLDASSDINSDGILSPGETWTYSSATEAAQELTVTTKEDVWFTFNGHSSSSYTYGNERSFTSGEVSVDVTAFSSNSHGNDWKTAYVGDYSGGLGVINRHEDSSLHRTDNSGSVDYLLFQFDSEVAVDKALLKYVGSDSDISYWIGDRNGDITNLDDSILDGFSEGQSWGGSHDRWANINNNELTGDTLVISAMRGGSNDSFKLNKLGVDAFTTTSTDYVNIATVDTGLVSDTDFSGYINA